ncbi:MAG: transposase family protein [Moraxella sp.]|nr:transposase family protein [Moraxella sp.]
MATLQYFRGYRSYEQIAADFGIHETTLIRKSHWIECKLLKHGFHLNKPKITEADIIINTAEIQSIVPKKSKDSATLARKNTIP